MSSFVDIDNPTLSRVWSADLRLQRVHVVSFKGSGRRCGL